MVKIYYGGWAMSFKKPKGRFTWLFWVIVVLFAMNGCELSTQMEGTTEKTYDFEALSFLHMKNHINLTLVQDSMNYIKVIAPENLQKGLKPEISGDSIVLRDKNGMQWKGRYSYDVQMELHFTTMRIMFLFGSGHIDNRDTLHFDLFDIWTNKSSHIIDLTLDANYFHLGLSTGSSDIYISGKANSASVWSTSYSMVNMLELETDIVDVHNNSTNHIYVYPINQLKSLVGYSGNVYYKGSPGIIDTSRTGSGNTFSYP
jgi:hypothetical protein